MDDVLYAIRVTKDNKFIGYVTEIGIWWFTLSLSKARLYRGKNFADIRCEKINRYRKNEGIKSEVINIKLIPQRKDDE